MVIPSLFEHFGNDLEKIGLRFIGQLIRQQAKKPRRRQANKTFLSCLTPLSRIGINLSGISFPYLKWRHSLTDILQPVYGLGNICKGIAGIALTPVVFVTSMIRYAIRFAHQTKESGLRKAAISLFTSISTNIIRSLFWAIEGICDTVRGISQIALYPITLLVLVPCRAIHRILPITFEVQKVPVMIDLVGLCITAIKENKYIQAKVHARTLHWQFEILRSEGFDTNLDVATENRYFAKVNKERYNPNGTPSCKELIQYLALFKNDQAHPNFEEIKSLGGTPQPTSRPRTSRH